MALPLFANQYQRGGLIGHLLDARELTAKRGGDPNHWLDVRDVFPLLSRPRWYQQTKYGYTRGREAVDFVVNVRAYYDIISWLTSGAPVLPPPPLRLEQKLHLSDPPSSSSAPIAEDAPPTPATNDFGEEPKPEAADPPSGDEPAKPAPPPAAEGPRQLDEAEAG